MIDIDWAAMNRRVIEEFRSTGVVGGELSGMPIVILTVTGARSGLPRQVPLLYRRIDDRIVVIASKAGSPNNPDWYHNLIASPAVTVEVAGESYPGFAVEVTGEERDRLFAAMAADDPKIAESERKTARTIPVFAIERAA